MILMGVHTKELVVCISMNQIMILQQSRNFISMITMMTLKYHKIFVLEYLILKTIQAIVSIQILLLIVAKRETLLLIL